jgi:hypothetical protein
LRPEDAPGETDILCDDVLLLHFDYYDARDKKWVTEWSTVAADGQPDRLPSRVRISLTVRDERGKEIAFQTESRVMMQEPLQLKPQDFNTGGGGGGGKANNEACTADADCKSQKCSAQKCAQGVKQANADCKENEECVSNVCAAATPPPPNPAQPATPGQPTQQQQQGKKCK